MDITVTDWNGEEITLVNPEIINDDGNIILVKMDEYAFPTEYFSGETARQIREALEEYGKNKPKKRKGRKK